MREPQGRKLGQTEFVILMALISSLLALSIDAILPALPNVGIDLGVDSQNHTQLIVPALFLGVAVGQILFGPLSDSIGRKPAVYIGLVIFVIGNVISILSTSFSMMLIGRVLQGFGVAGPRIVSIALVRDQYEGREMARIMSLILMVFIIVPVIAPALGQGILFFAPWRFIFGFSVCLALISFIWFALRQPETLVKTKRAPFSVRQLSIGVRQTFANRCALGYTVTAGLIFGAFVGYLSSAQQIFQIQYGLGELFPLFFGGLALAVGAASYFNSRLVLKYGMRFLSWRALQSMSGISVIFFVITFMSNGLLPLWALMIWGGLSFFCVGILFGNLNAMAMEPLGHIAGTAAAVIGSVTSLMSILFGGYISQIYNGTALPLIGGFAFLGIASLGVMLWTERGTIAA